MSDRQRSRGNRRPGKRGGGGSSRSRPKQSGPLEELHPTENPPDIDTFRHWELGEELQKGIEAMGITSPTPIQALAIGPVLEGRDVIAKAETGTGKTLAFGAPILARADVDRATVLALILCPTRELAQQVANVMTELGAARDIKVALVVGGDDMHPQVAALRDGAQIVVGTPGRVLDLYNQRFLQFPWTEWVVLDEADEMLEIGFLPDVKKILSFTPDERNTLLFSATFPPELLRLAREETKDPVEIATASGVSTVSTIKQLFVPLGDIDRGMALVRLIETSEKDDVFLVFCERRTDVDRLMRRLERLPFSIRALHGGYDQAARFRVMSAFRTGEVKALVATDVASRGLDILHVTHVVNFTPPKDISDYTHRIGRTGRAGREGCAITLVGEEDSYNWRSLERAMKWDVERMELPPRGGRRPQRDSGSRSERPARGPKPEAEGERGSRRRRSETEAEREPRRRRPEADGEREPRQRRPEAEAEREPRRRRPEGDGEREPRRRRPEAEGEREPRQRRPEADGEREPRRRSPEADGEREPRRRRPEADGERASRSTRPEADGEREARPDRSGTGDGEPRRRRGRSRGREETAQDGDRGTNERDDRPRGRRREPARDAGARESGRRESGNRPSAEERPRKETRNDQPARDRSEPRKEPRAGEGNLGFGAGV